MTVKMRCKTLIICALIAIVGCRGDHKSDDLPEWVKQAGNDYHQGVEYDMSAQMRLAEMYDRKAYVAMKEDPEELLWLYGEAGFRYSYMMFIRGDKEGALAIASEVLAEAEKYPDFPTAQMSALLYEMALCEKQMGQFDAAKETYLKAYEARAKEVGGENRGNLNMVLMCACLFDLYLTTREFDGAEYWLRRSAEELAAWEKVDDAEAHLVREYWDIYALNRAAMLLQQGRKREANAVFDSIPDSHFITPQCVVTAAGYLMKAGRYAEAADMYKRYDDAFPPDTTYITFDYLKGDLAPRYKANRQAGRIDMALALSDSICNAIDTALARQKRNDAAELAIVYQTHEKELALEESREQTRTFRILFLAVAIIVILTVWILIRMRSYNKALSEKNGVLYEQIQQREQAEAEERDRQQEQPTETLSQSRQLYKRLLKLMENPEVYTDATCNHETLACLAGTNRTYVYDALHECADTTPTDFINLYRIRHAARLLAITDDPVGLIVEQCGITNRSTFARLFRDHYSMSPTEYRRAAKGEK